MPTLISPPETRTVTSHGLIISILGKSTPVGGITRFGSQQQFAATRNFAFGDEIVGFNHARPAAGEPFEVTPGNLTGATISFERFEIYTALAMDELALTRIDSLSFQKVPLTVKEVILGPNRRFQLVKIYYGAYITDLSIQNDASGDRTIKASGSMTFQTVRSPEAPKSTSDLLVSTV